MLNRRHLRIKVMQALYAFFQSENNDLRKGEKELLFSIEKIYDLYISILLIIPEIVDFAIRTQEEAKQKMLPTAEDLDPNTKFINNRFVKQLSKNSELYRKAENRKISWRNEPELIKKIFLLVKNSDEYFEYMKSSDSSYEEDKEFIIKIFKKYISEFELLYHYFEEKSIYWMDDFELVNSIIVKTIKTFTPGSNEHTPLMPLYKDEEDDRNFAIELFRKTIIHNKEYETLIAEKTQNWEVERIAMMDVLLMKMAIAETLNFPSIPVKVTLNEFIEISKNYSTPKSKLFINGILDKLLADFKTGGKINKVGRGLME